MSKRLALACDPHLPVTPTFQWPSPLTFALLISLQCCGDAAWGDWRPHLAVMLSNKVGDTELNQRAIVTMGDTLGELGAALQCHRAGPCWGWH